MQALVPNRLNLNIVSRTLTAHFTLHLHLGKGSEIKELSLTLDDHLLAQFQAAKVFPTVVKIALSSIFTGRMQTCQYSSVNT